MSAGVVIVKCEYGMSRAGEHKFRFIKRSISHLRLRLLPLHSECLHTLRGHTSTVRCMRVLDGRPIAVSGSRDSTLRVWDIEKGECLHLLSGHEHSVRCIEVSGNKVVSGSYDSTCRVSHVFPLTAHATRVKVLLLIAHFLFDSAMGRRQRSMPSRFQRSRSPNLCCRFRRNPNRYGKFGLDCSDMERYDGVSAMSFRVPSSIWSENAEYHFLSVPQRIPRASSRPHLSRWSTHLSTPVSFLCDTCDTRHGRFRWKSNRFRPLDIRYDPSPVRSRQLSYVSTSRREVHRHGWE